LAGVGEDGQRLEFPSVAELKEWREYAGVDAELAWLEYVGPGSVTRALVQRFGTPLTLPVFTQDDSVADIKAAISGLAKPANISAQTAVLIDGRDELRVVARGPDCIEMLERALAWREKELGSD
jgi:hypothetical protein